MNEVIVSMENITKTFPGVKALDNVQFHLRAGTVEALLGENGAGKSTLMSEEAEHTKIVKINIDEDPQRSLHKR